MVEPAELRAPLIVFHALVAQEDRSPTAVVMLDPRPENQPETVSLADDNAPVMASHPVVAQSLIVPTAVDTALPIPENQPDTVLTIPENVEEMVLKALVKGVLIPLSTPANSLLLLTPPNMPEKNPVTVSQTPLMAFQALTNGALIASRMPPRPASPVIDVQMPVKNPTTVSQTPLMASHADTKGVLIVLRMPVSPASPAMLVQMPEKNPATASQTPLIVSHAPVIKPVMAFHTASAVDLTPFQTVSQSVPKGLRNALTSPLRRLSAMRPIETMAFQTETKMLFAPSQAPLQSPLNSAVKVSMRPDRIPETSSNTLTIVSHAASKIGASPLQKPSQTPRINSPMALKLIPRAASLEAMVSFSFVNALLRRSQMAVTLFLNSSFVFQR